MNQSSIDAQFQDLNRRLVEAFQVLGKFLGELRGQINTIKTDVEAIKSQGGLGSTTGADGNLLTRAEFLQGMQLIGQRLQDLSRQVAEDHTGGAAESSLQMALAQLPTAIDGILQGHSLRLQQSFDTATRHEIETAGLLEARLIALENGLRQFADQAALSVSAAASRDLQALAGRLDALEFLLRQPPVQNEAHVALAPEVLARLENLDAALVSLQSGLPETVERAIGHTTLRVEDRIAEQLAPVTSALESVRVAVEGASTERLDAEVRVLAEQIAAMHSRVRDLHVPDLSEELRALPDRISDAVAALLPPDPADSLADLPRQVAQAVAEALPPDPTPVLAALPEAVSSAVTDAVCSALPPDPAEKLAYLPQEVATAVSALVLSRLPEDPGPVLDQLPDRVTEAVAARLGAVTAEQLAALEAHVTAAVTTAVDPEPPHWAQEIQAKLDQLLPGLDRRLGSLHEQLDGLPRHSAEAEWLNALDDRLQAMESRWQEQASLLAGATATGEPNGAAADATLLAGVLSRLDALHAQIGRMPGAIEASSAEVERELTGRIDLLVSQIEALQVSTRDLAKGDGGSSPVQEGLQKIDERLEQIAAGVTAPSVPPVVEVGVPDWAERVTPLFEELEHARAAAEQRQAEELARLRDLAQRLEQVAGAPQEPVWVSRLEDLLSRLESEPASADTPEWVERIHQTAERLEHLAAPTELPAAPEPQWLDRLEKQLDRLVTESPADSPETDLASLHQRLENIGAAVSELRELSSVAGEVPQRLATLESRLDAFREQMTASPFPASENGIPAVLEQRLESLQQRLDAALTARAESAQLNATLEERFQRLEQALQSRESGSTAAEQARMRALESRLEAIERRLMGIMPVDPAPVVQLSEQRLQQRLDQIDASLRRISLVPPRTPAATSRTAATEPPAVFTAPPATSPAVSVPATSLPPSAATEPTLNQLFQMPSPGTGVTAPTHQAGSSSTAEPAAPDDLTAALMESYGFDN